MGNVINILKGVMFTFLGYIGIKMISGEQAIHVEIQYHSIGHYITMLMPLILLIWGFSFLYRLIKKRYRAFQEVHNKEITKLCDDQ